MVIVCKDTFTQDELFQEHFDKFPFPLSDFQKYAIKAIVEGDHILVTAHTGSGKTLLLHVNIKQYLHYAKKYGKKDFNKVLLVTPNEGLSNQHLSEFKESNIKAEIFSKSSGALFSGEMVEIIEK